MNSDYFSQILGNERIKMQLELMISKNMIGHALLFAGPDGVGKSLFAWALAARIFSEYNVPEKDVNQIERIQSGKHPDVHIYRPEGKLGMHSIQALRELSDEVHLPPYEAAWKVFIIFEADRMLKTSANALLKTFEEPPSRTLIILLSRSQSTLLPTILSRCCILHFQGVPISQIANYLQQRCALDEPTASTIAIQSQGSIGGALRLFKEGDSSRSELLQCLAQSSFQDYRALQECVHLLSERVEIRKKQVEEAAKEEFDKMYSDQLTVQQQQAVEKELEGVIALTIAEEAKAIFEHILFWYRDMQLLLLNGSSSLLMNPDFYSELNQAIQRGESKPLDQVYQFIEEANLAIQRSTPLSLCLETLFLKLDRL